MIADNLRREFEHLGDPEPALMHGQLIGVDSQRGSAILNIYPNWRIALRFPASLEDRVHDLNRRFVKIRGYGWFDDDDNWVVVVIDELEYPEMTPSVLDDPNPKIFRLLDVPPMAMPDEMWRAFDNAISESRGRRGS